MFRERNRYHDKHCQSSEGYPFPPCIPQIYNQENDDSYSDDDGRNSENKKENKGNYCGYIHSESNDWLIFSCVKLSKIKIYVTVRRSRHPCYFIWHFKYENLLLFDADQQSTKHTTDPYTLSQISNKSPVIFFQKLIEYI